MNKKTVEICCGGCGLIWEGAYDANVRCPECNNSGKEDHSKSIFDCSSKKWELCRAGVELFLRENGFAFHYREQKMLNGGNSAMLKDRAKLLDDELGLYVCIIDSWTDPILYLLEGENFHQLTVPSGVFEFSFGHFLMFKETNIVDRNTIIKILNYIAEENSVFPLHDKLEFKLKYQYLEKLKTMTNS